PGRPSCSRHAAARRPRGQAARLGHGGGAAARRRASGRARGLLHRCGRVARFRAAGTAAGIWHGCRHLARLRESDSVAGGEAACMRIRARMSISAPFIRPLGEASSRSPIHETFCDMITNPQFEERGEQPYVAIRTNVSMQEIAGAIPPLIPKVYQWLGRNGHAPSGPLFFRYVRMDGGRIDVELAVPVAEGVSATDEIIGATLPAGRYAVARLKGPYDNLPKAWSAFEAWREQEGIAEQAEITQDGTRRGTRTEHYLVGPNDTPDARQWETELALYLGEGA